MNIHQNARTNPYSRALLVARVGGGWTAAAAAASFGISVRTVRKWRARERAEGAAGLVDRSSRPLQPCGSDGRGLAQDDPPAAALSADRGRDRGPPRARSLDGRG